MISNVENETLFKTIIYPISIRLALVYHHVYLVFYVSLGTHYPICIGRYDEIKIFRDYKLILTRNPA